MTDLFEPLTPPNLGAPRPRVCRRHSWMVEGVISPTETTFITRCSRCGKPHDVAVSSRGRRNRARGNRHELHAARRYGGEKTGPLGGPEDIRGAEWRTQVKTHQGLPPRWLMDPFARMADQHDGRSPRTLHRWLRPGLAPLDLIVVEGSAWLDKFGPDE